MRILLHFQKTISVVVFTLLFLQIGFIFQPQLALAQIDQSTGTILPKLSDGSIDCDQLINHFEGGYGFQTVEGVGSQTSKNYQETDTLACAIKTGRVSLGMVPYFIKYISNFILGLVGLISILFVVLGGFFYTVGGLTENKEKGKKFIQNALTGLVVAVMAWSIVNVIIGALTG